MVVFYTKQPSERCHEVCERIRKAKATTGSAQNARDCAVGKTPSVATDGVMTTLANRVADADEALAAWAVHAGVPAAAICQRQPLFVEAIQKILAVGPAYRVATGEVLMHNRERSEGSRQGGLFIALKTMQREKRQALEGAEETGGTLVSDGAKHQD